MRQRSDAFYQRLQGDGLDLAELIDLELQNGVSYHWTTANGRILYTLSGQLTPYDPFPGNGGNLQEDMMLGVTQIDFTIANTGDTLRNSLVSTDFALAGIKIGTVFTDTPDLGRMELYTGKVGDFTHDRMEINGQARNIWKSLNVQWPYYTYSDKCAWRFGSAGCGFNTSSITLNIGSINANSSNTLAFTLNSGTLSNSYANGRFNFGRATITGGVNSGTIRTIMAHTGDLIQFSHVLPNPDLTGAALSIFPGCNKRLIDDCTSLYNNNKNFFGFPWIPLQGDAF